MTPGSKEFSPAFGFCRAFVLHRSVLALPFYLLISRCSKFPHVRPAFGPFDVLLSTPFVEESFWDIIILYMCLPPNLSVLIDGTLPLFLKLEYNEWSNGPLRWGWG